MRSVFEGWTRKIENTTEDNNGGRCAMGYLLAEFGYRKSDEIGTRIGRWIQQNLDPPERWLSLSPRSKPIEAVFWANDMSQLDIDGFKMVDLLSQGYVPENADKEVPHDQCV